MHYKFIAQSAIEEEDVKISPFGELIRKIQVQEFKKNKMLSISTKIPKKAKKPGSLQPVLPLVPEKLPSVDEDKGNFITFELKLRVGAPNNATKYKKAVRKFEEGTPQAWIDLLKDLAEIWRQNSIEETDRVSTVRAIVRGESLTAFESALQDARTNEAGEEEEITNEHVQTALEAVATTVFPHRALEIQKLWMNRRMFKPADLPTRQTAAAITRLNNCLPLFPGGSDASKFTEQEIVGLLEWSLPPQWRTKFDLDGYIPSLDTKTRLIEACEAIERNELVEDKESSNKKKKGKDAKAKSENPENTNKKGEKKKKKFFCTEHGQNTSHSTSDCWTLKNRASKGNGSGGTSNTPPARSFSNKALRKEINLLARSSSKEKILESYATVIQREQAKLAKRRTNKRKKSDETSDGESDDDMSIQVIEPPPSDVKRVKSNIRTNSMANMRASLKTSVAKANKATEDKLQEENAYQRRLQWLDEHGESFANGRPKNSDDESDNEN